MKDERALFDAWLGGQYGRVTGWMVWCASLAARFARLDEARAAFDAWLIFARAEDWTLFDAWEAAAQWALTSNPVPQRVAVQDL